MIKRNLKTVGMKKTLVYHKGRAPRGERTNWVMHEYRLLEEGSSSTSGSLLGAYVICRIFQKSGPGPKNGEQYGAPLMEEEWDDDEEDVVEPKMPPSFLNHVGASPEPPAPMDVPVLVPKNEDVSGTVPGPSRASLDLGKDAVDSKDIQDGIDQFLLYSGGQSEDRLNSFFSDGIAEFNVCEQNSDFSMLDKKLLPAHEWNPYDGFAYPEDSQVFQEQQNVDPLAHDDTVGDICTPDLDGIYQPLENDYYLELDDLAKSVDPQSPAVEAAETTDNPLAYFDASAPSFPVEDGSFLEINDLSNPMDADSSSFEMLDELLSFFDATESNLYEVGSSSRVLEEADIIHDHPSIKPEVDETLMPDAGQLPSHVPDAGQLPSHVHAADQSTSRKISDAYPWTSDGILKGKRSDRIPRRPDSNYEGGWVSSLSKRVHGMLESIPAPPASAAEYPIKVVKSSIQAPAVYGPSSIHITAATIRISYDGTDEGPLYKTRYLSVFSIKDDLYSAEPITALSGHPAVLEVSGRKAFSFFVRACLHFFGLVMLLAVSHKLRSCICAR